MSYHPGPSNCPQVSRSQHLCTKCHQHLQRPTEALLVDTGTPNIIELRCGRCNVIQVLCAICSKRMDAVSKDELSTNHVRKIKYFTKKHKASCSEGQHSNTEQHPTTDADELHNQGDGGLTNERIEEKQSTDALDTQGYGGLTDERIQEKQSNDALDTQHQEDGGSFEKEDDDELHNQGDGGLTDERIQEKQSTDALDTQHQEDVGLFEKEDDDKLFGKLAFGEASKVYFRNERECCEANGGIRCLAQQCLYEDPLIMGKMASLTMTSVALQMLILVDELSPEHKYRLVGLLAGCFALFVASVRDQLRDQCISLPAFPTTMSALNKVMIGNKKTSMWSKLPCEELLDVWGHAAISLDSLIDHLMAHGVPLGFIQDENGITCSEGVAGSRAASELLKKLRKIVKDSGKWDPDRTAFGYIIPWSDGFTTSFVKRKDGSCWCMTATIAPPRDDVRSVYHTHCIALGRKGEDHNKAVLEYFDEIENIRKGKWRYDGRKKKFVYTSFDVIAYMADRPERDDILRLLGHTGLSSKRFRYAAYPNTNVLPSCSKCFSGLLRSILKSKESHEATEIATCNKCCNWKYAHSDVWRRAAPKLQSYPTSISKESQESVGIPKGREIGVASGVTYVEPIELNCSSLKQGAELTMEEVGNGHWTATQGKAFLKGMAIRDQQAAAIVEEGKKRKADQLYTPNVEVIPSIWSKGYELDTFIDCPMHLLFLGITKALVRCLQSFMTSYKLWSEFQAFINPLLEDIGAFGLQYCQVRPLVDSHWISDNYLALARILPWAYGLFCIGFEPSSENREQFQAELILMQQLINSYHVMISALMYRDYIGCTDEESRKRLSKIVDQKIKVFLTTCHRFSEAIGDPFWESRGNFFSLLNLSEQILKFGPLRDWWDGNFEAGIQRIRPGLKRVRRTGNSYFHHKLRYARKQRHLKIIKENYFQDLDEEVFFDFLALADGVVDDFDAGMPEKPKFYANFHRYADVEEIKTRLADPYPLCGFYKIKETGCVYVAHGKGRGAIKYYRITYGHSEHIPCTGLNYTHMKLIDTELESTKDQLLSTISGYCLLLPYIDRKAQDTGATNQSMHSIVRFNWEVDGDAHGISELPGYSEILFADDLEE